MFFRYTLKQTVLIPPSELGPLLNRRLEFHLREKVENQRIPEIGLIIAVIDIVANNLEGRILDTGFVSFQLQYDAIVYRLYRDEVIDTLVREVKPDGFFADAGAATVFVSRYNIPLDFVFETDGKDAKFVKKDGTQHLQEGQRVRLRIVSEAAKAQTFQAIGTIKGDFLGPQ